MDHFAGLTVRSRRTKRLPIGGRHGQDRCGKLKGGPRASLKSFLQKVPGRTLSLTYGSQADWIGSRTAIPQWLFQSFRPGPKQSNRWSVLKSGTLPAGN